MHNQKKDNNKFKNSKQPELPENQTAWNFDNEGSKETINQTGGKEMGSQVEETHGKEADCEGGAG